jgi:hypothetical protein
MAVLRDRWSRTGTRARAEPGRGKGPRVVALVDRSAFAPGFTRTFTTEEIQEPIFLAHGAPNTAPASLESVLGVGCDLLSIDGAAETRLSWGCLRVTPGHQATYIPNIIMIGFADPGNASPSSTRTRSRTRNWVKAYTKWETLHPDHT